MIFSANDEGEMVRQQNVQTQPHVPVPKAGWLILTHACMSAVGFHRAEYAIKLAVLANN